MLLFIHENHVAVRFIHLKFVCLLGKIEGSTAVACINAVVFLHESSVADRFIGRTCVFLSKIMVSPNMRSQMLCFAKKHLICRLMHLKCVGFTLRERPYPKPLCHKCVCLLSKSGWPTTDA